jgi:hypothetical protein
MRAAGAGKGVSTPFARRARCPPDIRARAGIAGESGRLPGPPGPPGHAIFVANHRNSISPISRTAISPLFWAVLTV